MSARLRAPLVAACLATAAAALADVPKWYAAGFSGRSLILLGSSDPRKGHGFGIAADLGESARLRWGSQPGHLVLEAYYQRSTSPGVRRDPPNSTQAWGLLALSRYRWYQGLGVPAFLDVGIGLQHASEITRDLDSKISFTPALDLGLIVGRNPERALIGARYLHISNAGLVGNNQGQNQLYLLLLIPF